MIILWILAGIVGAVIALSLIASHEGEIQVQHVAIALLMACFGFFGLLMALVACVIGFFENNGGKVIWKKK